MIARPGRRRSFRHVVNCDLELRPLMNVFIVLIPMLLMSAVFIEIRVIEMSLPDVAQAAESPPAEALDLVIRILPDAWVVEGRGVAAQVIAIPPPAGRTSATDATSHPLTQALARIVEEHAGTHDVRIAADPTTRYQAIVTTMDLARAAGLTDVGLESTEQAQ